MAFVGKIRCTTSNVEQAVVVTNSFFIGTLSCAVAPAPPPLLVCALSRIRYKPAAKRAYDMTKSISASRCAFSLVDGACACWLRASWSPDGKTPRSINCLAWRDVVWCPPFVPHGLAGVGGGRGWGLPPCGGKQWRVPLLAVLFLGIGGYGGGRGARQEYVISRRFPQKFSKRVLQQYKYHFKRISVLDNYAILESLPTTARTSLLFAQYHDAVDQLSFLQAC